MIYELSNPDPSKFYRPPLAKVPDELYNEFTQNGDMPFTSNNYFNDVYPDSDKKENKNMKIITKKEVDVFRLDKNNTRGGVTYNDRHNHELMPKYSDYIKGKLMVVIGTIRPWLEAISLDTGARKVVTLGKLINLIQYKRLITLLFGFILINLRLIKPFIVYNQILLKIKRLHKKTI